MESNVAQKVDGHLVVHHRQLDGKSKSAITDLDLVEARALTAKINAAATQLWVLVERAYTGW